MYEAISVKIHVTVSTAQVTLIHCVSASVRGKILYFKEKINSYKTESLTS